MTENYYVRACLAATKAGIPDPGLMVDCWLDRLRDTLDIGPITAGEQYDLLALWARLRRCRPELIQNCRGMEDLARADREVHRRGCEAAEAALTLPNPKAWREETRELESAFEQALPCETRISLASRLLDDLDDAELVLYAARRLGVDDPELEEELEECNNWMSENVDLFLAASVEIQATGMAMRPDLSAFDAELAGTTLKYVMLLDAAEDAEAEISLDCVPALPPPAVASLVEKYRQSVRRTKQQRERVLNVFRMLGATMVRNRLVSRPFAMAEKQTVPALPHVFRWESPTRDSVARLVLPAELEPEGTVAIEFVAADYRPAKSLAGHPITLRGLQARLDSEARAAFSVALLLESDEPAVLLVGESQEEWNLVSEEEPS